MSKYKQVISLGYFCSTAEEIKRIGLRKASYPFDWVRCASFEKAVALIETNFQDFFTYDCFYQMKIDPCYYVNRRFAVEFYHDFSMYRPLEKQFDKFKEKYERRIRRFYEDISSPTLFIRYLSRFDIEYVKQNNERIRALIKSFNSDNEILYVCHESFDLGDISAFYVKNDEGDTVARSFLEQCLELKKYMLDNVEPVTTTGRRSEGAFGKIRRKISSAIRKIFRKLGLYYRHSKTV